jgi:hypothetical protein
VTVDELFQPAAAPYQAFDRATNPVVESVVRDHADVFRNWSEAEFGELASQFGTGGPLSEAGVLAAAEAINAKHALLQQICVILESSKSELLSEFVRLLYQRIRVTASGDSQ